MKRGILVTLAFFAFVMLVVFLYAQQFNITGDSILGFATKMSVEDVNPFNRVIEAIIFQFRSLFAQGGPLLQPIGAIYVDNSLTGGNCLGQYDPTQPAGSRCGSGSDDAYDTIQKAANVVVAGDTVLVRGGTYNEQIVIPASGSIGSYITFKNYQNEQVIITESGATIDPAIIIDNREYIVIDGFTDIYGLRMRITISFKTMISLALIIREVEKLCISITLSLISS